MNNQQLTANVVVLTTAISALLALFGQGEKKQFISVFQEKIEQLQELSLAKAAPDQWLDAIEQESKAFLVKISHT
jgi:hypothetical protein